MTLEMARQLKKGDTIYCTDSFDGSYPVEVTTEPGYVDSPGSPIVSLGFLTMLYNINGKEFYPCWNYELTYEEAQRKEMTN